MCTRPARTVRPNLKLTETKDLLQVCFYIYIQNTVPYMRSTSYGRVFAAPVAPSWRVAKFRAHRRAHRCESHMESQRLLGRTYLTGSGKGQGCQSGHCDCACAARCREARGGRSDASRTRHTCTRGKPGHPYTVGTLALAPALVRTVRPLACLLSATGPTRNPPNTPSCPTPYTITRHPGGITPSR